MKRTIIILLFVFCCAVAVFWGPLASSLFDWYLGYYAKNSAGMNWHAEEIVVEGGTVRLVKPQLQGVRDDLAFHADRIEMTYVIHPLTLGVDFTLTVDNPIMALTSGADLGFLGRMFEGEGGIVTYRSKVKVAGGVIALQDEKRKEPQIIISYAVGGLWEALFAVIRGHEITEGFLVTGILFALVLPPTIPYWMVAVGVSIGVIFGKEVFGGAGMNIVNPALACRAFLFFGYPGKMSGSVWVGTNPTVVRESLIKMNQDAGKSALDGYTQASKLSQFNVPLEIKRVHIDAIATNNLGHNVGTIDTVEHHFTKWNDTGHHNAKLGELTQDQLREFVTSPTLDGGLGLSPGSYEDAYHFSSLNYGLGDNHDWGFFLGNKLGSLGETSTLACLFGALFLIYTGIGSWRTMVAMGLGAYVTALLFQLSSTYLAADNGAWTSAQFGFPAYKHFILGGLAFGMVFMATDPVSHPGINGAKWIYGIFCGMVAIVIRVINPAYPEGVMLAILMGNVFAPLFDYYAALNVRKKGGRRVRAAA